MPQPDLEKPGGVSASPETVSAASDEVIAFSADHLATLRDLARSQNINLSQAVGQAIDIAKMVVSIDRAKGERLLVQKGQQLQELTLQ